MWPTYRLLVQRESSSVPLWSKHATPSARNMVRRILRNNADSVGMTTKQLYNRIHEVYPDAKQPAPPPFVIQPTMKGKFGRRPKPVPEPPHREHPIRSVKFLKKVVMEEMAREGEVKKVPATQCELLHEDVPPPRTAGGRNTLVEPPVTFYWALITPAGDNPPA